MVGNSSGFKWAWKEKSLVVLTLLLLGMHSVAWRKDSCITSGALERFESCKYSCICI